MEQAVIVSGARTAVGNFGGALKDTPVVELGSTVIRAALERAGARPILSEAMRAGVPDKLRDQGLIPIEEDGSGWDESATPVAIDEVIMGNVLQAGQGQNPARQAMIRAGITKETPAFSINKECGSGLKAITLAAS
ncbi:MAG TPA: acetyl-CoA C-acyltransferase, partial [Desulfofustis sp.]|nr:acetyl-CoA C-acyltransferase [Desulfofustis sp.]